MRVGPSEACPIQNYPSRSEGIVEIRIWVFSTPSPLLLHASSGATVQRHFGGFCAAINESHGISNSHLTSTAAERETRHPLVASSAPRRRFYQHCNSTTTGGSISCTIK